MLVCAIVLPVLLLAGLVFAQLQSNENTELERRTVRDSQSIAMPVNAILRDMATTVRLLATAPGLESGDLKAFHDRTSLALRNSAVFAILVDESGQQLLNTSVPFGVPLGSYANLPLLEAAFDSGLLEISDVYNDDSSQEWVFSLVLPLSREAFPEGRALVVTRNAKDLNEIVTPEGLPDAWFAGVLDKKGRFVASSDLENHPREEAFALVDNTAFDSLSGAAFGEYEDEKIILGHSQLSAWGWTAIVWGPVVTAQASILDTLAALIFGGIVLLALAIGSAIFVADRLGNSIRGIAQMAQGVGNGEIVSPIDSNISEIDMIAKTLSTASFDRNQAEEQIRLVLRELAHRSKNLLTVVLAIIRQIARRSKTVDEFRTEIEKRVGGLARSIELLTAQDWEGVDIRQLIDTHLATFVDSKERIIKKGPRLLLKPEAVQSLGLVLHELATNAAKYGALSVPEGTIAIEWFVTDPDADRPKLTLSWSENGGPHVNEPDSKGFGTEIIERHAAAAFGGEVSVSYQPSGYRWIATGPLSSFVMKHYQPV